MFYGLASRLDLPPSGFLVLGIGTDGSVAWDRVVKIVLYI
jgi:hypothetical protein